VRAERRPRFSFRPRPAEVDLLCRDPRIAVEIDGYFHFRDPAGYRRDRTKDWELQRRGYLVLRFLAEDVIPRLEEICDPILDALARPSSRRLILGGGTSVWLPNWPASSAGPNRFGRTSCRSSSWHASEHDVRCRASPGRHHPLLKRQSRC